MPENGAMGWAIRLAGLVIGEDVAGGTERPHGGQTKVRKTPYLSPGHGRDFDVIVNRRMVGNSRPAGRRSRTPTARRGALRCIACLTPQACRSTHCAPASP